MRETSGGKGSEAGVSPSTSKDQRGRGGVHARAREQGGAIRWRRGAEPDGLVEEGLAFQILGSLSKGVSVCHVEVGSTGQDSRVCGGCYRGQKIRAVHSAESLEDAGVRDDAKS